MIREDKGLDVRTGILDFYSGAAPDDRGRLLSEIQGWPDDRLEVVHNYIQGLFPLPEPSPVNPAAPLLNAATIREFHARPELREHLRASFLRMLRFYGLELREGLVTRAANFAERSPNWLWPGNHNHLSITRILRCLRLAGTGCEAPALLPLLRPHFHKHPTPARSNPPATIPFWSHAAAPT